MSKLRVSWLANESEAEVRYFSDAILSELARQVDIRKIDSKSDLKDTDVLFSLGKSKEQMPPRLNRQIPHVRWVCNTLANDELETELSQLLEDEEQALVFTSRRELAEFKRILGSNGEKLAQGCRFGKEPKCYYLPYPADISLRQSEERSSRKDVLYLALCGKPCVEDRIHVLFRALLQSNCRHELHWMLAEDDLGAALKLGAEFSVRIFPHTPNSIAKWQALVAESDIAFHLLVSARRSLGPNLGVSLASGCATVVSSFAEGAMLEDGVAIKISTGFTEERELLELLKLFSERKRNEGRELQVVAQEYARENFSPQVIAQELAMIFKMECENGGRQ